MFQQTVSLWRRLTGSSPRADKMDERRAWARYPAEVPIVYRPADASPDTRCTATVQNISVGGLSLRLDQPIEPGKLLAVELPGPAANDCSTVLACVVHLAPQGGGTWVIGCTFARELSDEDLIAFGARRTRPEPEDQRSWWRYAGKVRASYQVAAEECTTATCSAQVLNLSASGVGLLISEALEPGVLLSVELCSPNGSVQKTVLACVVHVSRRGDSQWAVGCNFIADLSEADLVTMKS
jgi:hypothetical protein